MVKCPNCGIRIYWDNSYVGFCNDRKEYMPCHTIIDSEEESLMSICCECGEVLGFSYSTKEQATIFNHQELEGTDWESKENIV